MNLETLRGAMMEAGSVLLLGAFTAVHAAAATPTHGKPASEKPPVVSAPLVGKVSTNDVLRINVDGAPALSARYRVDLRGGIDYPFVGRLTVLGLKPAAVATLIADGLKKGKTGKSDPKVSVEIVPEQEASK